jgi:hypothetical protein
VVDRNYQPLGGALQFAMDRRQVAGIFTLVAGSTGGLWSSQFDSELDLLDR